MGKRHLVEMIAARLFAQDVSTAAALQDALIFLAAQASFQYLDVPAFAINSHDILVGRRGVGGEQCQPVFFAAGREQTQALLRPHH